MRYLIVGEDYPEFLDSLYADRPELAGAPYGEQYRARMASLFFLADFYSRNLRQLGHEAWEVHTNNRSMQLAWLREQGLEPPSAQSWRHHVKRLLRPLRPMLRGTPLERLGPAARRTLGWSDPDDGWRFDTLARQIRAYRPDVIVDQAPHSHHAFFAELRPRPRLLVAQHAALLPPGTNLGCYDLAISSLPNLVSRFRSAGLDAELLRHAFEPSVLDDLQASGPLWDVSFVGSINWGHEQRRRWLETVTRRLPVQIWGSSGGILPEDSRASHNGVAFGGDLYRVLAASRVTLNRHMDGADGHANNLRLYEATGVGTALVTDWKDDLVELFEPDDEVVAYRDADECVERTLYLLEHESVRLEVAKAGQRRTLRDHTYARRMEELDAIVRRRL